LEIFYVVRFETNLAHLQMAFIFLIYILRRNARNKKECSYETKGRHRLKIKIWLIF
jgi:hypothetical protein